MDKLVKLVMDQTGVDESTARKAIEVVIGYMQNNLPEPLNKHADALVKGEIDDVSDLLGGAGGGLGSMLGGLFGGKK